MIRKRIIFIMIPLGGMNDRKKEFDLINTMLTWSKESRTAWRGVCDKVEQIFFCPPFFCQLNVFARCFCNAGLWLNIVKIKKYNIER
jgi:hypothetical protein